MSNNDKKLKLLRRKRDLINNKLQTFSNYLNSLNENSDANIEIKIRLDNTIKLLDEFETIQLEIDVTFDQIPEAEEQCRDNFINLYFRVIALANSILEKDEERKK